MKSELNLLKYRDEQGVGHTMNIDRDALLSIIGDIGFNIDKIYPVGSIYMSINSASPADLFGGTWEQLKDRFLLSAGDSYVAGATGGAATNSHTHNVTTAGSVGGHTLTVNEMPSHGHSFADGFSWGWGYTDATESIQASAQGGYWGNNCLTTRRGNTVNNVGGNGSHSHGFTGSTVKSGTPSNTNNMPPYLAVYMWKRTA